MAHGGQSKSITDLEKQHTTHSMNFWYNNTTIFHGGYTGTATQASRTQPTVRRTQSKGEPEQQ